MILHNWVWGVLLTTFVVGSFLGNLLALYVGSKIDQFCESQNALREEIDSLNADIAEREARIMGYKLHKRCKNCSCE